MVDIAQTTGQVDRDHYYVGTLHTCALFLQWKWLIYSSIRSGTLLVSTFVEVSKSISCARKEEPYLDIVVGFFDHSTAPVVQIGRDQVRNTPRVVVRI